MDLFGSDRGVCVKVMPAPQAVLEVRTSGGLSAFKALPALWWMAHRVVEAGQGFDLVHAIHRRHLLLLRWLLIGAPPVIHLRDILTARHFSSLNRRIAVTLANTCATNVLVNSPCNWRSLCRSWGRKELVRLVYNGFALDAFGDLGQGKATEIRAELELAMLHWCAASLSYWKGQHVLLKPCANTRCSCPVSW